MSEITAAAFYSLVDGRRGHFRLESGHHGARWLDLDSLFADTRRVQPFVDALANLIRPYQASAVCGPLLGGAFLAQLIAQALEVEFCFTQRVTSADTNGLYTTRYILPSALVAWVRDKRVAMVDDVMSAGSALRGTFAELRSHGADPVVAGALLVLGTAGVKFFEEQRVSVEAVARDTYELWKPDSCPLCTQGVALEDVAR
jgi:orotate phosphoribosyltransferase